ncbi:MAG TPA: hypothetical protein DEQ34_00095 [Balneolaceae bacterium]|nr:hypothetical protein [Balneolaceae bacterium]|tara:strand:- start:63283 stop:64002 length:720 start_codon:yes stop_codon:yes gene_type:complete
MKALQIFSGFLLVVTFLPHAVNAQFNSDESAPISETITYDINVFIGAPQNDFQDNLDRAAVGIDFAGAFKFPDTPVQFGAEIGIMTYGMDERKEPFNPNIPEVTVTVETSYDILTGHLFLRFEPETGRVKPYLDGLFGFKYLFTETKIGDSNNYDTIASDTNFDDTALSYGFGAGLKIRLAQNSKQNIYLNLKSRYLFGNEATYLKPGSITINNGSLQFAEETSSTDLFQFELGVAFGM